MLRQPRVVAVLHMPHLLLISFRLQVVAAVNQQLGGLASQRAVLQHDLGAAKERWQAEETVRIR